MIITIVGLGVIGGSYAKALQNKGHTIYGIDHNQESIDQAIELGVIKDGSLHGDKFVDQSDIVIISLYPSLVIDFVKNHQFKKGCIITDATGIKEYMLQAVLTSLDEDVEFISGHPMAGREKRGFEYSSADVYKDANYLLVPHDKNKPETIKIMEELIYSMGFRRIRYLSAKEHDEIISFTSQLPHVLAVALINSDKQKYDTGNYIGDSYRDLTRIANINEDLWSELFLRNHANLIESIHQFEDQLSLIKTALINQDEEALRKLFIQSSIRREKLNP